MLRPFLDNFEVLGTLKTTLDFCCFFKGSWEGLLAHLGGQKALEEDQLEQFCNTLVRPLEMWKWCSRAGGSIIFEKTEGPEQSQMHHCEHLFFRMRLGEHFLQKRADLGLHWALFGSLRRHFSTTFQVFFQSLILGRFWRYFLEGPAAGVGPLLYADLAEN